MPAKTPMYLKTSTPKRGKKLRLRDVLSSDMISPPLGDFRHSAHIGQGGEGDMFGDISFLQGNYDLLPNLNRRPTSQSTGQGLDGKRNYERAFNNGAGGYPTLLKNAVSLPAFSGAHKGQDQEQAPPKPPRLHLEEGTGQRSLSVSCSTECFHSTEEMFTIPTFSKTVGSSVSLLAESNTSSECSVIGIGQLDGKRALIFNSEMSLNNENLFPSDSYLSGSESSLGLDLDLGPSILDDVLRIMDGYKIQ
ncbi:cdc42 effector protein 2 [Carcharodon carcharias]|uniref:cdc42 effector protein 2 n=1 Tax=Carcharodon carcharias TaxID=13397 RepID=UPI001B7E2D8A|nr:cdc42 effector protein 2 [Carcharodon carcharias]XP_041035024.1 cdc42 effector protein 2 [Carcharodon carcharias]